MAKLSDLNKNISVLVWGITVGEIQELCNKYPTCEVSYTDSGMPCLYIDNIGVCNFKGDCGTLSIDGANIASDSSLDFLAEFASLSGFSTILATVCLANPKSVVNMFLNKGWRVVKNSESNRNPKREHYVLLLSIDCVHKGY